MDYSILFLGFLIGMRHALEADHVAAVASLATGGSSLRGTIFQGAVWGLGHTITLFVFCSIALLADNIIPDNFAAALEFAVGIMLILLGADVLYRLYKKRIHFHAHKHDNGINHFHAHAHKQQNHLASSHQHQHKEQFPKRALFVGLMHGMAGSAALIVLTINTVATPIAALTYIALFGVGSIVGMAVLSCVIAVPLKYSNTNLTWVYNTLHLTIALFTLSIGGMMVGDYLLTSI